MLPTSTAGDRWLLQPVQDTFSGGDNYRRRVLHNVCTDRVVERRHHEVKDITPLALIVLLLLRRSLVSLPTRQTRRIIRVDGLTQPARPTMQAKQCRRAP